MNDTPGSNHPPPKTANEYLREDLAEQTKDDLRNLIAREEQLKKAAIVDEDSASRMTDLGGVFLTIGQNFDKERLKTSLPFREKTDIVNAHYGPLTIRAKVALETVQGLIKVWRDAQKAKLSALAAANPGLEIAAKPKLTRGSYGAAAGDKVTTTIEIVDYAKAFARVSTNSNVREAILKAIKALDKAKEILTEEDHGVKITKDSDVVIRS